MSDSPKFASHFWGNLDKFLLSAFIVFFVIFAWFVVKYGPNPDSGFVAVMLDNTKTLIGTLLGLMTGRAWGRLEERNKGTATAPTEKTGGTPTP